MDDPLKGEVEIMKGNEVIKGKGSKEGMGVNQRESLGEPPGGVGSWEEEEPEERRVRDINCFHN